MEISVTDTEEALLQLNGGVAVDKVVLEFTTGNWNSAQTVTVIGQNDDIADGDIMYDVEFASTSEDEAYNGVLTTVPAINLDDDIVGISVSAGDLLVTGEGGTHDTLSIQLDTEPKDTVTVTVETDNPAESQLTSGTQGPGASVTLTFTADDWDTAQVVTVTGQDDGTDDGNVSYHIIVTPSSADEAYDLLDPISLSALNLDNDDDSSMRLRYIDDFEDGSLSEYKELNVSGTSLSLKAARDGNYGLADATDGGWLYRTDSAAQVGPGNVISVWVNMEKNADGRAYFGFGAVTKGRPSGQGTLAMVMAPNSNSLLLQEVVGFNTYNVIASASQTWLPDKWYRMEVEWGQNGLIVGRLFDSDGVTLLNAVAATNTNFKGGGIAFRAFGAVKNFDNVELRTAPLTSPLHASQAANTDQGEQGTPLTAERIQAALQQSLAYWATAGAASSPQLSRMSRASVQVADLPGSLLGMASPSNTIWLDDDAAGFGWPGPMTSRPAGSPGYVSLVDVLTHELGHLAGYDHDAKWAIMQSHLDVFSDSTVTDSDDFMRTPLADAVFSATGQIASDASTGHDLKYAAGPKPHERVYMDLPTGSPNRGSALDALFLELETEAGRKLRERRLHVSDDLLLGETNQIDGDLIDLLADG